MCYVIWVPGHSWSWAEFLLREDTKAHLSNLFGDRVRHRKNKLCKRDKRAREKEAPAGRGGLRARERTLEAGAEGESHWKGLYSYRERCLNLVDGKKKCLKMNFVKLCPFPFTNVANAILPSNILRQAMSTWESGCAGNDGDLGWAVKEGVEETLMIYSQEAWRLLQHRLTAQRATERTAGMKRLHARRSQEEQIRLVSSFLYLDLHCPAQSRSSCVTPAHLCPVPCCLRPPVSWPSPRPSFNGHILSSMHLILKKQP